MRARGKAKPKEKATVAATPKDRIHALRNRISKAIIGSRYNAKEFKNSPNLPEIQKASFERIIGMRNELNSIRKGAKAHLIVQKYSTPEQHCLVIQINKLRNQAALEASYRYGASEGMTREIIARQIRTLRAELKSARRG